jgi:hypothetical protein
MKTFFFSNDILNEQIFHCFCFPFYFLYSYIFCFVYVDGCRIIIDDISISFPLECGFGVF